MKPSPFLSFNIAFLTLGFFIYVLYIGASIIIPFVVAVLLSFLTLSIAGFYRGYGIHKYISFVCSLITIFFVIYIAAKIINTNIEEIIVASPVYQEKLLGMFDTYAQKYDVNSTIVRDMLIAKIDITALVTSAA